MTSETPDLLLISLSLSDGSPHSEEACLRSSAYYMLLVNSLCGLGSCPLVWHMHGVCL